jgi:endonuclease YncB( thermonuclease family)
MARERWLWPNSRVVRVIDGDSVIAEVHRDLGFHGTATFTQRLRMNRINTPPVKTAAGTAARDYLAGLVVRPDPLTIETVGPYKYGDEWMAEFTLPDGRNVSALMVEAGHAVWWDGTGPRPDTPPAANP